MASTMRSFCAMTDWMVGKGGSASEMEGCCCCSHGWVLAREALGDVSSRKPRAVIKQQQGVSRPREGKLSTGRVSDCRLLKREWGSGEICMSEHVSSVMEKFSSCQRATVSLVSIVLPMESRQLGRDRRS